MNPYTIAKFATAAVVSLSSSAVIGNVIKTALPASTGLISKIGFAVGTFTISNVLGDKITKAYFGNIEAAEAGIDVFKESIKSDKE